jgi:GT2 family glycosyltransferase
MAQDHPGLQVLVVDNAPPGGTPAPADAGEVLALGANLGFAGGMNRGAAVAIARGAAWLLLVNDDAVLAPDAVGKLVAAGFPLATPTIRHGLPGAPGGPAAPAWYAGGQVSPWTGEPTHDAEAPPPGAAPRAVTFAPGCCLLVEADAWRRLGGLDEAFFLYHEDVDLCLRAAAAGLAIGWVPGAVAWHEGGASTGSQAAKAPLLDYYDARNGLRVVRTRLRGPRKAVGLAWWALVRLPRKLARIVARAPDRRASLAAAIAGARDGLRGRTGPRPG